MRTPTVSIVIRAKNEERWIGRCLRMVVAQDYKDFEIIIVDNNSSDHTIAIARKYPVKVVQIEKFLPGKAINMGIRASTGKFIVCLSAHCIPRDKQWLGGLVRNMENEPVAGVYGRQLPMSYSSNLDKRDLMNLFGLDHRIQIKDSFFHNANSLFRRSVWDHIPFDETVTNVEDRLWGEAVIKAGLRIAYEPDAAVYHHHGIHQDGDEERARGVVRILESLEGGRPESTKAHELSCIVLMPVLGSAVKIKDHDLIDRCLGQLAASGLGRPCLIADDPETLAKAERLGARLIRRPPALSSAAVGIEQVLQYALNECETGAAHYDAVLYVNYLFPFRPKGFFNKIITEFERCGADSLVPVLPDFSSAWIVSSEQVVRADSGFLPRGLRKPLQRGLVGLGTVTSSEFVRQGRLLGDSVALAPLDHKIYAARANDPFDRAVIEIALERGEQTFGGAA